MLCTKCRIEKSKSDFYPSVSRTCKKCILLAGDKWRKDNPEKNRAKMARHRAKRKDRQAIYYKEWYAKNGRKANPLKSSAHSLVFQAVKEGRLVRPAQCSKCDRTERIEGHHEDYYKPLEVIWLCNRCHRILHNGWS